MLPSQPRGRPASLLLLLLLLCLALSLPFSHSHSLADVSYPFQNASLPLPVRLSNLLSLLTLDEKLSLLYQSSPPIPRLSIPRFDAGQECLHGLINRRSDLTQDGASTAFPQSIGLAASWNRSVFTEMGRIIGDEARGKRNLRLRTNDTSSAVAPTYLMCWTPVVNILKDPRWGRSAETYGEAPLLTYALTSRLVQALHGDDERYIKIAPTLKHFTAYDGPEEGHITHSCHPPHHPHPFPPSPHPPPTPHPFQPPHPRPVSPCQVVTPSTPWSARATCTTRSRSCTGV